MGASLTSRLNEFLNRTTKSHKGHDILMYLLFACVAFIFWIFLSLENEVQRDFEIPISLDHQPDSIILIGDLPSHINVVVQAKGSQLLSYSWGKMPELKLRFTEDSRSNNFYMSRERFESRVRDYFGQSVQVVAIKPDTIKVAYTTSKGKKLPIKLRLDAKPNLQCVINGDITCNIDSATVYTNSKLPSELVYLQTEPVVLSNLKDTTIVEAKLEHIYGAKMIPDRVRIRIPVEPLIAKRRQESINVINKPDDVGFLTFPSSVEVTYLVPMSRYQDDFPVKVYVDYSTLDTRNNRIKVNHAPVPSIYRNLSLSVDSVEYVVERRNK